MAEGGKAKAGAFGFGLFFVGIILLLIAGIVHLIRQSDYTKADSWKKRPWTPQTCTVVQTGISYRGTCQNWFDGTTYTECTENGGQAQDSGFWNPGERTQSTSCIDHTDALWDSGESRRLTPTEDEGNGKFLSEPSQAGELKESDGAGRGLSSCTNKYLPWALVRLPKDEQGEEKVRCAFRWGAEWPSLEEWWDSAERFYTSDFTAGKQATCYILPQDDCPVAMGYPMDEIEAWFWGGTWAMFMVGIVFVSAGCLCCICSMILMGVGGGSNSREFSDLSSSE